jgi:hypothetical protein
MGIITNRYHFSLHRAGVPKECDLCGCEIPAPRRPDYAEYWRVKGGARHPDTPRIICCLCFCLFDFPTDGWVTAPDGRETIATLIPAPGCGISRGNTAHDQNVIFSI